MQKLSVTVLEHMIKSKISSKEVDFILYVGKYQNEYGTAEGIYYKDICDAAGLSCQGFYPKDIYPCGREIYKDIIRIYRKAIKIYINAWKIYKRVIDLYIHYS